MASSDHLKPGETGSITATLSVPMMHGKIEKTVKVHTNDPRRQIVTLSIKAFVDIRLLRKELEQHLPPSRRSE